MRHICGIIVAEKKGKQGKEDKVRENYLIAYLLNF
jgi:hypothetical protein